MGRAEHGVHRNWGWTPKFQAWAEFGRANEPGDMPESLGQAGDVQEVTAGQGEELTDDAWTAGRDPKEPVEGGDIYGPSSECVERRRLMQHREIHASKCGGKEKEAKTGKRKE